MKRFLASFVLLLGLALAARGTSLYYSGTIAATQANTATSFIDNHSGGSAAAFNARRVVIINDGPNAVYVDLKDTTATTADRKVASGESFSQVWDSGLGGEGWAGIGLICAAGETASVRVWAER